MGFKSMAEINAAISAACLGAVAEVATEVHLEFYYALMNYYGEFSPTSYIRTGGLLNSLQTTGAVSTGNGARAKIYFETPGYKQGLMYLQHTHQSGIYGWATWDGGTVLSTAMAGSHGGKFSGTPIWDSVMGKLGGESGIKAKLLAALKARLPIK